MPFGEDCQFESFDACVAAMLEGGHSEEEAGNICGALMRDTEER